MGRKKGKILRVISLQDQETSITEIPDLPSELIPIVLSKLPIKSLLQCKCVCKSWLKMLRDPRFAYAHLAHSTATRSGTILWCRTFSSNKLHLLDPESFKLSDEINWIPKVYRGPLKNTLVEVVGSCNGFVCLARLFESVPVYVCNPLTGQFLELPPSPHRARDRAVLGIGFASNTKEYKVVRMIKGYVEGVRISHVEVYTLGTGYWRSKDSISYTLNSIYRWDAFVNGALHWMTETPNQMTIVSFDVGDEEFREIPLPDLDPISVSMYSRYVGVIEGCLCLHNYSRQGCIDIWIMKDYGVKDSWSKYFGFSEERFFFPLDMGRNGRPILGYCRGKLISYDVASEKFTDLQLNDVPTLHLVYPYLGSFITLESAREGQKMSEREMGNLEFDGKKISSCTYINQLPDGVKIRVYARLGQPGGLHTCKLSYWCHCLARDGRLLPIDSTSWRKFDNATKDRVWQMVLEKFDIDEELKDYVVQFIGKIWKDNKGELKAKYFDNCVAPEDEYVHCPPTIIPDQWQTLVNFWDSKERKKRTEMNKQNGSHQTISKTAETKSFVGVHHEECQMQEVSKVSTSQNDIFAQFMRLERHGHVLGDGLGATPNSLLGSSSSHDGPSASDFIAIKNKVEQLEEQMKQKDTEILEIRSMIQAISRQMVQGPMDPTSG